MKATVEVAPWLRRAARFERAKTLFLMNILTSRIGLSTLNSQFRKSRADRPPRARDGRLWADGMDESPYMRSVRVRLYSREPGISNLSHLIQARAKTAIDRPKMVFARKMLLQPGF